MILGSLAGWGASAIRHASVVAALAGTLVAAGTAGAEEAEWAPYPVQVWQDPFNMDAERKSVDYEPVDSARQKWNICVALPHLKDSYWKAVNFGLVEEAKRVGVSMSIHNAGGYTELEKHKQQIRACAGNGADAVIIGAISSDELNDLVGELDDQGIPVVDLVNGMSADKLDAKSLVDFGEMGSRTGEHLAGLISGSEARIAWFPGPEGASWVAAGDRGFKGALKDTNATIVETVYGDTRPDVQEDLVRQTLEAHDDLNYIVGNAVTASTAVDVLKEMDRTDVKVVSFYLTPSVYRAIRTGDIKAAPTDSPVIQARIAVNQAVRILEDKSYHKHVGPEIVVLDRSTINFFNYLSALPPRGFEPVSRVQ